MIEAVEAVKARNGDDMQGWELECFAKAWNSHNIHVHSHHSNEDDTLVPVLKGRFHYPDKCVSDHDELVAQLDVINALVKKFQEKDSSPSAEQLLKELTHYETIMIPHLKQEEDECLPLTRAYFTPQEYGKEIEKIMSSSPKVELGSFVAVMGVDTFRNDFMKQEKIPCFVWYIKFKGCFKAFTKEFQLPIDKLKAGKK